MNRIAPFAVVLTALSGCIVYETDDPYPYDPDPGGQVANYAPYTVWADAGCYWDNYNHDDVWYFEAEVDDPDGVYDVIAVYADVWDTWDGRWVDSFELYPTADPYFWFSDWLGSSTWLSCYYPDYAVDFVAYDAFDAYSVYTTSPWTYTGW